MLAQLYAPVAGKRHWLVVWPRVIVLMRLLHGWASVDTAPAVTCDTSSTRPATGGKSETGEALIPQPDQHEPTLIAPELVANPHPIWSCGNVRSRHKTFRRETERADAAVAGQWHRDRQTATGLVSPQLIHSGDP